MPKCFVWNKLFHQLSLIFNKPALTFRLWWRQRFIWSDSCDSRCIQMAEPLWLKHWQPRNFPAPPAGSYVSIWRLTLQGEEWDQLCSQWRTSSYHRCRRCSFTCLKTFSTNEFTELRHKWRKTPIVRLDWYWYFRMGLKSCVCTYLHMFLRMFKYI